MDLRDRLQATLGEQYTLERELGGAGMSRVFVVAERDVARRLVDKVLPPEVSASVDVERFRREIQLVAAFQHPHIVPFVSTGARDGLLFYTMPFIAGESLRGRLDRQGPLPVAEVVRLLRDVVDALAFAHAQGVVHRDIKPDNVLISGRHALVADFGVARALSSAGEGNTLTATGVALGTAAYMSPEQAAAESTVDHRADIYAVGALAYELLAGRPPFVGASVQQVMAAHLTQPPDPITRHRESVSPALADLIMRCLAKKPGDRWQSAEELLAQIERIEATSPLAVPKPPKPRRSVIAGVAGATALGLLVAGAILWPRDHHLVVAVILRAGAANANAADILPDQIAERLTRALINAAPPGQLSVISPGSAEQFRGKADKLDSIRANLKADHIVTVKVTHLGSLATVSADLVNTSTGTARKGWTYEVRADTAMLSIPTRIASGVIDELGLRAAGRGSRRHEPTPEAADAYQRGLIVARRLEDKADLDLAVTYFRKASAADSLYAEPYAMGAFVHQLASGLAGVPPTYAYPIADSLAWRAIQLDSNNAEAHAAFGFAEGVTAWRWEVAEREIIKALELDPNSPLAHLDYSILLATRGEQLRAIDEVNAAIRVDPQDAPKYLFRMLWYTQLGEPDSAIASFRQAQSKAPGFLFEGFFIGDAYRHRGMLDSAIALDSLASVGQGYPTPGLVMSLFARRQRDDAERAYHELEIAAQTGRFQLPEEVARAAEVLGDRDAALRWLGVAKSQHSDIMLLERYFPEMQSLRQDPRYRAMLREMRLPF